MLSKRMHRARIALVCLLIGGCQSAVSGLVDERAEQSEVNLSFVVENNLLRLNTVRLGDRPGRFYLGTAHPRTVVSPAFAGPAPARRQTLQLNDRHSLEVEPIVADLGGIGEAIIGFEAWRDHAITINYVSGLVVYQQSGTTGSEVVLFPFHDQPEVTITVNGTTMAAVVDTASPDTLVLPRNGAAPGRMRGRIDIAGSVFPDVDIALADTSRPRLGNRLLSKFLVSIDYGRRQVGLWRDPRVPIE